MSLLTLDDLNDEEGKIYLRYRHKSGKVGEFELTLEVLRQWVKDTQGSQELELTAGQQDYDFEFEPEDIQGDHQLLIKGEDWTWSAGVLHFDAGTYPITDESYVKILKYWKI